MYLKGYEYEVIEEPLRKWTKWMQDWSAEAGERPRVPVLRYIAVNKDREEQEMVMPESNEIDLFLDALDGKPEYTPEEGTKAYKDMWLWWSWCDDEMKPALDLYKYGKDLNWNREDNITYMAELVTYIEKLEDHLKDHPYLVDDRLTLADVAVIPFIRQIMRVRNGEFDFTPYPHVVKWTSTILETEWFNEIVMKKHPLAEVGV